MLRLELDCSLLDDNALTVDDQITRGLDEECDTHCNKSTLPVRWFLDDMPPRVAERAIDVDLFYNLIVLSPGVGVVGILLVAVELVENHLSFGFATLQDEPSRTLRNPVKADDGQQRPEASDG